jgi:hypothetical protein
MDLVAKREDDCRRRPGAGESRVAGAEEIAQASAKIAGGPAGIAGPDAQIARILDF